MNTTKRKTNHGCSLEEESKEKLLRHLEELQFRLEYLKGFLPHVESEKECSLINKAISYLMSLIIDIIKELSYPNAPRDSPWHSVKSKFEEEGDSIIEEEHIHDIYCYFEQFFEIRNDLQNAPLELSSDQTVDEIIDKNRKEIVKTQVVTAASSSPGKKRYPLFCPKCGGALVKDDYLIWKCEKCKTSFTKCSECYRISLDKETGECYLCPYKELIRKRNSFNGFIS